MHNDSLAGAAPHYHFLLCSPEHGACCLPCNSLVMRLFHACCKLLTFTLQHILCPLHSFVGSHCCIGSHFWAQRIGAACLAFLRLKVPTSSSTKTPIVPSRPQILQPSERQVAWLHQSFTSLFSKGKLNRSGTGPAVANASV